MNMILLSPNIERKSHSRFRQQQITITITLFHPFSIIDLFFFPLHYNEIHVVASMDIFPL
jgi:hypothetical protein